MDNTRQRLLIVDDTEYIREFLLCCLGPMYDCAATANAAAAVDKLGAGDFELVITDISMPGMSGLELCEYIRCNYPKTVVIVMSGNQEEAYETAATQRGALGFLRKPFEGRAILEIVRAALVKRGSAEESERF